MTAHLLPPRAPYMFILHTLLSLLFSACKRDARRVRGLRRGRSGNCTGRGRMPRVERASPDRSLRDRSRVTGDRDRIAPADLAAPIPERHVEELQMLEHAVMPVVWETRRLCIVPRQVRRQVARRIGTGC